MGSGVSFRSHDEDDEYGSEGVIRRIPIEIKQKGRLGKLGLHSVKSFGKSKNSASLRSALSMDLEENPEILKIRKDHEMDLLKVENENANLQRKLQKFEQENRKLRTELMTLQKTCRKLKEEREAALDGERQALVRASALEADRDKVQRQFKIFRETKESELQNLLKTRMDLETKLNKYGQFGSQDLDSASKLDIGGGSANDWWATLESEPSLASTTIVNSASLRGPEYSHAMLEMEGPYIHVNKDDWMLATSHFSAPVSMDSAVSNIIRIFISAPADCSLEVDLLINEFGPQLRRLCSTEGYFLNLILMPCDRDDSYPSQWNEFHIRSRCRQLELANVFIAFLADTINRFTDTDFNLGHFNNPGSKPCVICFKELASSTTARNHTLELDELKRKIKMSTGVRLLDNYKKPKDAAQMVYQELEKILKIEMGVEDLSSTNTQPSPVVDSAELLCGGCTWDATSDNEALQALALASTSSCQLGFERYYERLNGHASSAGPLPPLLVCAPPGCGKSLLLAKWIELLQHRIPQGLVLYHLVGATSSCSADPIIMIRRLTAQLLQHLTLPPPLACDPVRLTEEFPRWLEKVAAKVSGGLVLVLDSADRFQNAEAQLKWLLDPLPVDACVVLSVCPDTCPPSWKSWPTLTLDQMTSKSIKELLRAEMSSRGRALMPEQENRILNHCRTPGTCLPLYVVVMAADLSRCNAGDDEMVDRRLDGYLQCGDSVSLFQSVIDSLRFEYETVETKGFLYRILRLIYAARNGLSDVELLDTVDGLSWNFWVPVLDALVDRHILAHRSGLLVFAHEEARHAVEEKLIQDQDSRILEKCRRQLRDYFCKFAMPPDVTHRVADELPWLNKELADKEALYNILVDLCVFVRLYGRGRCSELIGYWQYLGVDKITMSEAYYKACKQMEGMLGQFNGLVTLPRLADVYEALGRFLKDLNLLPEALTPLQRSLEIRETALDPDHPSVAQALHHVAGVHAQQGKYGTAEALYKQALDKFEAEYGPEHPLVARELEALSALCQRQGKHDVAEPLRKRALNIRKQTRNIQQHMSANRIDPTRKRALRLEELTMTFESADLARTLNELGVLYYLQANLETSESYLKRALVMRESVLGLNHLDVSQSLANLASLYLNNQRLKEAEPLYEKALTIRKMHFPIDHPSVASVLKHLGVLYKRMNKLDKAVPIYEALLDQRKQSMGSGHPLVATAMVNLAVIHSQTGNHSAALPLYEKALSIYESSLGTNHPRVAETLKNLSLLKYEQGDYEVAAAIYKRSTDITAKLESEVHRSSTLKSTTSDSVSTARARHK